MCGPRKLPVDDMVTMIRNQGGCFCQLTFRRICRLKPMAQIGAAERRVLSMSGDSMRLALAEVLHAARNK